MASSYNFTEFFDELGIVSSENSFLEDCHIITLKDGSKIKIEGKDLRSQGVTMANLMNLIREKIQGVKE